MSKFWEGIQQALLYADRYSWLRQHPAWETEAFLGGLTPEQFDAEIDKRIREETEPCA